MAKFILFEGSDGSGKTTALEFASEFLSERGINVIQTREPGSELIKSNQQFREIVKFNTDLNSMERELVFMADANRHSRYIKNILDKDRKSVILCDRGLYSHLVYQKATEIVGLLSIDDLKFLYRLVDRFVYKPDYTIIFDVDYETAKQRMTSRGKLDVIESLGEKFLVAVNNGYKELKSGHKLFKVNANKSIPEVQAELKKVLLKILAKEAC